MNDSSTNYQDAAVFDIIMSLGSVTDATLKQKYVAGNIMSVQMHFQSDISSNAASTQVTVDWFLSIASAQMRFQTAILSKAHGNTC